MMDNGGELKKLTCCDARKICFMFYQFVIQQQQQQQQQRGILLSSMTKATSAVFFLPSKFPFYHQDQTWHAALLTKYGSYFFINM